MMTNERPALAGMVWAGCGCVCCWLPAWRRVQGRYCRVGGVVVVVACCPSPLRTPAHIVVGVCGRVGV